MWPFLERFGLNPPIEGMIRGGKLKNKVAYLQAHSGWQ